MQTNDRPERERVFSAIRTYFASDYMAGVVADAALAALRPADGLVERLELAAVIIAPLGRASGGERWSAAETMREAATALRSQGEREAERAAIVAWLDEQDKSTDIRDAADAIRRGDHLGGTDAPTD